jgi:hypothetical protein
MRKKAKSLSKKSNKRRKSLIGGEILGKGGYGCVIVLDEKTVGKINYGNRPMYTEFGITSVDEFMSIQTEIFKLDPLENYFITTRKIIEIASNDLRIKDCVENDKNPPTKYDVYIQSRVLKPPPVSDWTSNQVQHAIDGLYMLHKNGYVHNDVSFNNFGFHNNMPVYIDMDGGSRSKPVRVRNVRGKCVVDLNETHAFDFQQLQKVFRS